MRKNLKMKIAVMGLAAALAFSSSIQTFAVTLEKAKAKDDHIRNIIVLISDGMSVDGVTLARWYRAYDPISGTIDVNQKMALDEMASGLVRTYWQADGVTGAITDSAPAGTAMATGKKTMDKFIGVTPSKKPTASILEAAKLSGKATGLVSTSQSMHATPAAFSSHYPDRAKEEIIAEQQVYNNIDIVLGGGSSRLAERADQEDLVAILKQRGYQYITSREEMEEISGKTWGMFAETDLAYESDRLENTPDQPALAEMADAAIKALNKNKDGFFLMIEGSKIDWAAHANDPIGLVSEINAFDQAVKVALDFAKNDNHTMVIAISDHGNGGITMGNLETTSTYSKDPVQKFVAPLHQARLTGEGIERKLDEERTNIKAVMSEFYGISDLTEQEEEAIKQTAKGRLNYTVGAMISKRASLGWTTNGHTGEEIVLYTYLPKNERITGVIENTDIAKICAGVWGLDLDAATKQLFNDAREVFEKRGAQVSIDQEDDANPQMIVIRGENRLVIPENKSYVEWNGIILETDGVNVHIDGNFYVSDQVLGLLP